MQIENRDIPSVLKVEDVGKILSVGRNTAYALIRSGQIRSIKIGRCYRVPMSAVVEYLEGKKTA